MDEYISREKALQFRLSVNASREANRVTVVRGVADAIAEYIKAIPPADVRPVVLCRDCKYRPYSTEPGETSGFAVEAPDRECKCPCFNPDDGYYSWIPADDFFCADGERRGVKMGGTDGRQE